MTRKKRVTALARTIRRDLGIGFIPSIELARAILKDRIEDIYKACEKHGVPTDIFYSIQPSISCGCCWDYIPTENLKRYRAQVQ